jgi:hypothetical protein
MKDNTEVHRFVVMKNVKKILAAESDRRSAPEF